MRLVSSILRFSICVWSGTMMLPRSSAITESDTACSSSVKPVELRRALTAFMCESPGASACRRADRVQPVADRGRRKRRCVTIVVVAVFRVVDVVRPARALRSGDVTRGEQHDVVTARAVNGKACVDARAAGAPAAFESIAPHRVVDDARPLVRREIRGERAAGPRVRRSRGYGYAPAARSDVACAVVPAVRPRIARARAALTVREQRAAHFQRDALLDEGHE